MDLITTVLVSVGLAADAFAVSLSSGTAIRHMKINKALKISLFFGCFQALMPLIGWLVGLSFRDWISAVDHWVAFGLLSCIGVKMIYESTQDELDDRKFNPLDICTLIVLSVATSLDALAVGFGFSVLKVSIAAVITAIGSITFSLSFVGVFVGHKFGDLFQNKVEMFGGLVLIIIGSKILVEHLVGISS